MKHTKEIFGAYELKYWFVVVCCFMMLSLFNPEWIIPFSFASFAVLFVAGFLTAKRLGDLR